MEEGWAAGTPLSDTALPPACPQGTVAPQAGIDVAWDRGHWMTALKSALGSGPGLFPIPPLPQPPKPRGRGRRPANRYRRALALWEHCERARAALNLSWDSRWAAELEERPPPSRFKHARVPGIVLEAWLRLISECRRIAAGRRASYLEWPTGAALYLQLTKKEGDLSYIAGSSTTRGGAYVPFSADHVQEPPADHRTVDLLRALPDDLAAVYADPRALFRDEDTCEQIRATYRGRYCRVLGEEAEWLRYLHRPEIRRLWALRRAADVRGTIGVASVLKKGGPAQRKILQSIPFNEMSWTPSQLLGYEVHYGLTGGAAVTQIGSSEAPACACTLDQSNAFTHVVTPEHWWVYMGGPRVKAGLLPRDWVAGRFDDDEYVSPVYQRLGMGHTHAAFLLMQVNMYVVARTLLLSSSLWARTDAYQVRIRLLNREEDVATRTRLGRGEAAVYIHIDDFLFLSDRLELSHAMRAAVAQSLCELGFGVTTSELGSGERYIGFCLSPPGRWGPTSLRLGLLDRVLEELARQPIVEVSAVHTALAIYIWCGLLWRPCLSAPQTLFAFIRQERAWCRPWQSVVRELQLMRGLLPFIYCDTSRPVCPVVFSQDAAVTPARPYRGGLQYGAYCLAACVPPIDQVKSVIASISTTGRGSVVPTALGGDPYTLGWAPELHLLSRTILPAGWFEGAVVWERLWARRWLHPLPIVEGELRSVD